MNGGLGGVLVVGSGRLDLATIDLAAGTHLFGFFGSQGTTVLESIEPAAGSRFADTITGSSGGNDLAGGAGNDSLIGGRS